MLIKELFTYTIAGMLVIMLSSSCRSLRTNSASSQPATREANGSLAKHNSEPSKRVYRGGVQQQSASSASRIILANPYLLINAETEKSQLLQFKYAVYIDVPVELLTDTLMLTFMDQWYGVKYRYGGSTKQGIDCSAFSSAMLSEVFGFQIPRTVRDQYLACTLLTKEELRQGDLVFFNTTGGISHVGVFLMNNKFVHASSTGGVMISDLNEVYFSKRFLGGGRVIL